MNLARNISMKTAIESSKETEYKVLTPCIKVCLLGEDDVCRSCGRTLDEIVNWRSYPKEKKLEIIDLLTKNFKQNERGKRR